MINILLAEDEKIVALDLRLGLKKLGYNVIKVVDKGLDLINEAIKSQPDVIVSDINLKDNISGIEAVNKIFRTKRFPVVIISGFYDTATKDAVNTLGPCAFVRKPCNAGELNTIINKCLQKKIGNKKSG